jgi:hypothetical protein
MSRILPLVALLSLLVLPGCFPEEATATPAGYHTYVLQGPGVPGGSTEPDVRMAERLCPDGYRVVNQVVRNGTPDGYSEERGEVFTNWTIRCL